MVKKILKNPFITLFSLFFFVVLVHQILPQNISYPYTPKKPVKDLYFDTTIIDPYQWLEDNYSPKTKSWVEKQNSTTNRYLRKISYRNNIEKRLKEVWDYPSYSIPFKKGNNYYFYKNDGMQNQSVLYTTESLDKEPEVLLDPNTLSKDGTIALRGTYFSKSCNYMGYALSKAGSDWIEFYILNLKTRNLLKDKINWVKFSGMSWHGNGFYYTKYPKPDKNNTLSGRNENSKVFYHLLGTTQDADKLVFFDPKTPRIAPSVATSSDEKFLFLYKSKGTYGNALFFRDSWNKTEGWDIIVDDYKAEIKIIDHYKGKFIAQTDRNAPYGRVVLIDPKNPGEEHWLTLLNGNKNEVLNSTTLVGGKLFAHFTKDVLSIWKVYAPNGDFLYKVDLPGKGIINGFNGHLTDKITWYSFNNFVTPTEIYQYNIQNNKSKIYKRSHAKFENEKYEMRQEFYISKDSTMIPIFIAHRKDLAFDMERPTLLYGYGGFNIAVKPYFNKSNIILLESGGVFASANIRGGGEYGQEWHESGMLFNKQNVFDDFIFAAKYLFKEGITSPDYLAIKGGSNGGLLVGAVINQRPELFRVAFPEVGVMDMLRYEKFTIGHAWAVEYGTAKEEKSFKNLLKYSPIHNVKRNLNYPSTFIYTADHDDRVVPAHSFKYAATLQNAQSTGNPKLIRIGKSAGHGAGKPTKKKIKEEAEKWSFMFYEMGLKY